MNTDLKTELFGLVHSLGFPLVGVAPPVPAPRHYTRFQEWLDAGFGSDMPYLATRRDRSEGADRILLGAQAALVLGLPYKHPTPSRPVAGRTGRISRYATGRDYHRIFESAFKKLTPWMTLQGGTQRAYVDYGPVMERALAQAAGLGFVGKNACLINPDYGSYVFLGVILTTLPLPVDSPLESQCGDCSLCLKACPTGALHATHSIDPRRCISFHTVENRGEIPAEIMDRMGNWVLGCDGCQEVCPFNRQARESLHPDILLERIPRHIDLATVLTCPENDFVARYAGTAAMRPKWTGFLRNAAIAVGNSGRTELLDALAIAQSQTTDTVIRHAIERARQRLNERSHKSP